MQAGLEVQVRQGIRVVARAMRGGDAMQESPSTVATLDDFVPADRPPRIIRVLVNDALAAMNAWFHEVPTPAYKSEYSRPSRNTRNAMRLELGATCSVPG